MNTDTSNTIFQKAVAFVNNTNKHLFITGKAGTGKTTFLKFIRDNTFKKMAVVAPTGVAAINAGGVTIHSFFQLPFGPFIPVDRGLPINGREINTRSSLLQNLKLRGAKRQVIQELDLLVIDEISMVRADLLDAIDTVMRHIRKQPFLPFGGVQIVYIGDLYQLPPVVRNEEWDVLQEFYKSPFFFDAHALQFVPPLFIELKKIYRQKDDTFIGILNNIRNNCCTSEDLDLLHRYYNPAFSPPKEGKFITLTSHNSMADAINEAELSKLPAKTHTYPAKISGEFQQSSYPADKDLLLKEGAQIMFIKNDKGEARKFYNGKIGSIKRIYPDRIIVAFSNNDELELEQETWRNINYNYNTETDKLEEEELGSFCQYPIKLAWAITIHKSQGLTFEKAVIDAGASFAPGQVYVSLSRLTSLQGLILRSRILPASISTDKRVVAFVQREIDEDALQQILEKEQKAFIRQTLLKSFSWARIVDALNVHLEDYEHRNIPQKEMCIEWANRTVTASVDQSEIAEKFIKQLEYLFSTCEQDGYRKLFERTSAATEYFLSQIDSNLLNPLKNHIEKMKVKQKVKKYIKELQQLSALFIRKKEQLEQARKLAEALHKEVRMDNLLEMVQRNKTIAAEFITEDPLKKAEKPEKGESNRISLQLFKQGKSIADIAADRELSVSTIEGHLANFVVTGEVNILDLVESKLLKTILSIIEKTPDLTSSEIRLQAGDEASYAAIKAVMLYRVRLKNEVTP